MKYLILLNRKFPYKSGEAFLENEIEEISGGFDRVLIYPSDVRDSDKQTRTVRSKNVDVRILEHSSFKSRKMSYCFGAVKHMSKSSAHGLKRKWTDGYFLDGVEKQFRKISRDLTEIGIKPGDEVFVYSYWLYINAGVACRLKEFFKEKGISVRAFSRAHRFDIYEEKARFSFLPQREQLLTQLDKIYACSDNGTDYLKSKYPRFSGKIETSYLGTYDHGVGKCSEDDVFRIVSCSRITDVKRVHLITEALMLLRNEGIKLCWTHLGGGDLYEDIKIKAKALDWMEVHLDGAISNKEVYEHYLNFPEDVFINVSSSEGLPVSIMEAASFGIPTIATDVGGTSEIVRDGVSGYILPESFSPRELADRILQLARFDKEAYVKLRTSTRELWLKYYQAPLNYAAFVKAINNIDGAKE